MPWAAHPLVDRQQGGELVAGTSRIPASPVQLARLERNGQRLGMLGAKHPLVDEQKRGESVAGTSRIPRLPSPVGETAEGIQCS